ncbi:MAG: glucodextranase DOMON-like domain-containing protein [Halanaerobium sp.]|nr:glucodextranase DOMON-like domain-containing protein [Halanaerobium sp.]
MQIWRRFFWLFALLFLLAVSLTVYLGLMSREEGELRAIFSCEDPIGDDYGPGTYVYPLGNTFAPYEGHLDLRSFKITADELNYYFIFQLGELLDPWGAPLGFSFPLLELFVDNQPGGMVKHIFPDVPLSFPGGREWDRLVRLSGWEIYLYASDREGKLVTPIEFYQDRVEIDGKTITLSLPVEVIGDLQGAGIWVFVGCWDIARKSSLRLVLEQSDYWHFGGKKGEWDLPYLDYLHPHYGEQEKQLLGLDGRPVIQPVEIKGRNMLFLIIPALGVVLLLYLFLLKKLPLVKRP